jgi:hypothetical protein
VIHRKDALNERLKHLAEVGDVNPSQSAMKSLMSVFVCSFFLSCIPISSDSISSLSPVALLHALCFSVSILLQFTVPSLPLPNHSRRSASDSLPKHDCTLHSLPPFPFHDCPHGFLQLPFPSALLRPHGRRDERPVSAVMITGGLFGVALDRERRRTVNRR